MINTGRVRSFTAVKGLSRHILARRAAVFHGPLDGCALLRGAVVPITGNSADREYFRDREASVRRRAAARRGWRRERRWGAAPHPGLSGELHRVPRQTTSSHRVLWSFVAKERAFVECSNSDDSSPERFQTRKLSTNCVI